MHDLVIRSGIVVDGTGTPKRVADIAVDGETITAVGGDVGAGRREIDASGLLVTPGFVDVHTHYDGQATWDPYLTPSSCHGVTTAVFGNCGVGFAPVRPGASPYLINLMEGVEDIPGTRAGRGRQVQLGILPGLPRRARPGAQDHGHRRAGAARCAALLRDGRARRRPRRARRPTRRSRGWASCSSRRSTAGALGFTTSRTIKHQAKDGRFTPSLSAARAGAVRPRRCDEAGRPRRDRGQLRFRARRVRGSARGG